MSRSEDEIYETVIDIAQRDDNIRAVILNGSRVKPNSFDENKLHDFDFIYVVEDVYAYIDADSWYANFGEILLMRYSEPFYQKNDFNTFTYHMQFKDFNRIDLTLTTADHLDDCIDLAYSKVLLDKDDAFENYSYVDTSYYETSSFSEAELKVAINDFYWYSTVVVKGIARTEFPYAVHIKEHEMRDAYKVILKERILLNSEKDAIDFGVSDKYLYHYLDRFNYDSYLRTFDNEGLHNLKESLLSMLNHFKFMLSEIERQRELDLDYEDYEDRAMKFLHYNLSY
ncbi:aminoglycoside 6-adenylyltransferase [Staphylococcus massiliensis]|uniref:Aminoglycoside 6-adenylyltransferase n=1 Tax=Staphylococcus massiliensis S46 TaxID=1229783 RepID=K9ASZ2_9STAP|nr:aminoglycoside 6-adenylyltransferase [Staphylococcus massiliensis]EKU50518.1 hypothetical protein C273_00815 [Staphylococcus massiliensis S46]MCG3401272.1 aminoglycoside 6-adenylyltransferase [Staphylococcus massiliensis]POA00388.1 hypothetical protein CD133_04670 [Staphylococcus massiliensis CCUG 55927]